MKNAPAVITEASSRAAVGGIVARGGAAATLTDNLRRAASGDAGSQHLMSAALRTATLRDDRYRRPLDYARSWRRYYADRAAERALSAVSWYTNRLEERTAGRRVHHA